MILVGLGVSGLFAKLVNSLTTQIGCRQNHDGIVHSSTLPRPQVQALAGCIVWSFEVIRLKFHYVDKTNDTLTKQTYNIILLRYQFKA